MNNFRQPKDLWQLVPLICRNFGRSFAASPFLPRNSSCNNALEQSNDLGFHGAEAIYESLSGM
jgi:hypothetical protein